MGFGCPRTDRCKSAHAQEDESKLRLHVCGCLQMCILCRSMELQTRYQLYTTIIRKSSLNDSIHSDSHATCLRLWKQEFGAPIAKGVRAALLFEMYSYWCLHMHHTCSTMLQCRRMHASTEWSDRYGTTCWARQADCHCLRWRGILHHTLSACLPLPLIACAPPGPLSPFPWSFFLPFHVCMCMYVYAYSWCPSKAIWINLCMFICICVAHSCKSEYMHIFMHMYVHSHTCESILMRLNKPSHACIIFRC